MAGASMHDHEIEVERSRAKLTQDLAVLCSPETFAAFTDDLKLRMDYDRPRSRHAAEKANELAPSHLPPVCTENLIGIV